MNAKDKAEYEKLTTAAQRADWLIRAAHREGGITCTPDIDPATLALRWRVAVLDVALPGPFTAETAEVAIKQGMEWLRKMAAWRERPIQKGHPVEAVDVDIGHPALAGDRWTREG